MKKTIIFCITLLMFSVVFTGCGGAAPPGGEKEGDITENPGIAGTWYYVKSTEGDDERILSPDEVEILREFEIEPPYLIIGEDNAILANFSTFEVKAELTQTDTYSFDIITEEAQYRHEDVYDFLTYDSESGLVRYTWNMAGINHYFSREMPPNLSPAPEIPGVTWLVPPTFAYEEILHCPAHGFLAYGGYWIDEKTGKRTGESCGHGVGSTVFLYDAREDLFGSHHRSETDSTFKFYSKEEFEAEYNFSMNNVNHFSGIDSTKVKQVPIYAKDGEEILFYEFEIEDGAFSGKIAVAYGCDFVTDFIYDEVERWRKPNDIIAVSADGRWGILDKEGNIAVPFVFDHAISIDDTTAFAKYNGRYGIISLK